MSKKRISLRIIGSKHPPFRLQIRPGTRISDIRAHLQLDTGYVLAYAFDPTDPFEEDDDVFSLVMDGERLIARLSVKAMQKRVAEAGAFMEQIAFGEGDL